MAGRFALDSGRHSTLRIMAVHDVNKSARLVVAERIAAAAKNGGEGQMRRSALRGRAALKAESCIFGLRQAHPQLDLRHADFALLYILDCLSHDEAAVYNQRTSCNERTVTGSQVDDGLGDFLRLSDPSARYRRNDFLFDTGHGEPPFDHFGAGRTRTDGVHSKACFSVFQGGGFGKSQDPVLAGLVGGLTGTRN
jgi:hypothetical protein